MTTRNGQTTDTLIPWLGRLNYEAMSATQNSVRFNARNRQIITILELNNSCGFKLKPNEVFQLKLTHRQLGRWMTPISERLQGIDYSPRYSLDEIDTFVAQLVTRAEMHKWR